MSNTYSPFGHATLQHPNGGATALAPSGAAGCDQEEAAAHHAPEPAPAPLEPGYEQPAAALAPAAAAAAAPAAAMRISASTEAGEAASTALVVEAPPQVDSAVLEREPGAGMGSAAATAAEAAEAMVAVPVHTELPGAGLPVVQAMSGLPPRPHAHMHTPKQQARAPGTAAEQHPLPPRPHAQPQTPQHGGTCAPLPEQAPDQVRAVGRARGRVSAALLHGGRTCLPVGVLLASMLVDKDGRAHDPGQCASRQA